MKMKDIRINPKLLKPFMETLNRVEEELRMEYMEKFILNDFDESIDKAYEYAKLKNVDFETAFNKVRVIRQPASPYCKDDLC